MSQLSSTCLIIQNFYCSCQFNNGKFRCIKQVCEFPKKTPVKILINVAISPVSILALEAPMLTPPSRPCIWYFDRDWPLLSRIRPHFCQKPTCWDLFYGHECWYNAETRQTACFHRAVVNTCCLAHDDKRARPSKSHNKRKLAPGS